MTADELLDHPEAKQVDEQIIEVDDHGEQTLFSVYQIGDKYYGLSYTSHPSYGINYDFDPEEVRPISKTIKDWEVVK